MFYYHTASRKSQILNISLNNTIISWKILFKQYYNNITQLGKGN